jgi:hypothetical protein
MGVPPVQGAGATTQTKGNKPLGDVSFDEFMAAKQYLLDEAHGYKPGSGTKREMVVNDQGGIATTFHKAEYRQYLAALNAPKRATAGGGKVDPNGDFGPKMMKAYERAIRAVRAGAAEK